MMILKKNLKTGAIIIVLIAVLVFVMLPILYSFIYSGFSDDEANKTNNNLLFPDKWTWSHYQKVFSSGYGKALMFSFVYALVLVILRLLFCGSAGYLLSQQKLKANRWIMIFFIFLSMIPENSLYLGLLTQINQWQLQQSVLLFISLAAPNIFSLFTILIFRDAFMNISDNHQKLMKIDQLKFWQKTALIFWPQLKHAVILVTVITTSIAWNSYLWPMILLPTNQNTLSTFIFSIGNLEDGTISYGVRMAGVVMYTLPVIIFYSLFHRKIIKSFTATLN